MSYDEYGSGWDPTSPNVARAVERYGAGQAGPQYGPAPWTNRHDDPDLMTRIWRGLFGQPKQAGITSQPLAPPEGAQAMDPASPFGGAQAPAAPPQYKPASTISSNHAINERINRMLNGPSPRVDEYDAGVPPPVTGAEWGMPDGSGASTAPMSYEPFAHGNPFNRVPFNLLSSGPIPDRTPRINMRGGDFDRLRPGNAATMPGAIANMSPFSRADGGSIPGFMRGGYPDLYGVDEPDNLPIRTFDSGGESYVGNEFSEAPGRADDVNAKLSAREYVIDAETMALLGDGNPDAGAKKMDEFRQNVRKHKGAALAKGKISPDAKPAASSYIAGNPLGDGMRRQSRGKA